jgi:predicted DNA-binding transcriptional regulator AlpA
MNAEFSPEVSVATPEQILVAPKVSAQITSLSVRQQDRLEADGRFPRSVLLSSNRKARVLSEVLAWNAARVAERDARAHK